MINTLEKFEFLEALKQSHLKRIANLCRGESYQEGQIIFKEGDKADELYLLVEGNVALEMDVLPVPTRPVIPTAVEVIRENEIFGWSALVKPYIYTLSARCLTRCRVLAIKGDMLYQIMDDDANLGYELSKRLTQIVALRLTQTRQRLTSGLGLSLLGEELKKIPS